MEFVYNRSPSDPPGTLRYAMAVEKICPECGALAPSYSPATGHQVWVTYYRCGECSALFYMPIDDPDATPVIVAHGDSSVRS